MLLIVFTVYFDRFDSQMAEGLNEEYIVVLDENVDNDDSATGFEVKNRKVKVMKGALCHYLCFFGKSDCCV